MVNYAFLIQMCHTFFSVRPHNLLKCFVLCCYEWAVCKMYDVSIVTIHFSIQDPRRIKNFQVCNLFFFFICTEKFSGLPFLWYCCFDCLALTWCQITALLQFKAGCQNPDLFSYDHKQKQKPDRSANHMLQWSKLKSNPGYFISSFTWTWHKEAWVFVSQHR